MNLSDGERPHADAWLLSSFSPQLDARWKVVTMARRHLTRRPAQPRVTGPCSLGAGLLYLLLLSTCLGQDTEGKGVHLPLSSYSFEVSPHLCFVCNSGSDKPEFLLSWDLISELSSELSWQAYLSNKHHRQFPDWWFLLSVVCWQSALLCLDSNNNIYLSVLSSISHNWILVNIWGFSPTSFHWIQIPTGYVCTHNLILF